ncbi:MAG: sigma-70 family RNA polymerase sigma factor, partial [Pirellulales bacterium]|nr:sigma-70 family RNA polymerase sigma factor [Pirellulales bacterium]
MSQTTQNPDPTSDADLLARFCCHRDEQAFSDLVHRHGPMVLGVCLQILRRHHDAQDAFQATFLILAMRPRAIHRESSLASWLYKVAFRTAMRSAKQRQRETTRLIEDDPVSSEDPLQTIYESSLLAALHEEMSKLPASYRAALVLCYLEGKTRREAADELQCTDSSIKAKLARAKQMLRVRLSRRGVLLSAALPLIYQTQAMAHPLLSPALVSWTATNALVSATLGPPHHLPSEVVTLVREGSSYMSLPVTTKMLACAAVFGMAIFGWALFAGQPPQQRPTTANGVHVISPPVRPAMDQTGTGPLKYVVGDPQGNIGSLTVFDNVIHVPNQDGVTLGWASTPPQENEILLTIDGESNFDLRQSS